MYISRMNSMISNNRMNIILTHITEPLNVQEKVGIIGVHHSVGQPIFGCEYGSSLMRERGLVSMLSLNNIVVDEGDVHLICEDDTQCSYSSSGLLIKNAWSVGQTSLNILERSLYVRNKGCIPLVIGGDHSIALGSVASALKNDPDVGILWIDAHADINTPDTSLTMNLHGMPLSLLMKLYDPLKIKGFKWLHNIPVLRPDRLVYIGLRDIDEDEKEIIKQMRITAYTMEDVKLYGIEKIMDMTLSLLKTKSIHVSWDIDSVDPLLVVSTGTKVEGGLSDNESFYIAERVASTKKLVSMDMVEINPLIGTTMESLRTVDIANNIICKMFS
jgi:arginase